MHRVRFCMPLILELNLCWKSNKRKAINVVNGTFLMAELISQ
jgi:hypothetical protein